MFERKLFTINPRALGRRPMFVRAATPAAAATAFAETVGLIATDFKADYEDGKEFVSFRLGTGADFIAYETLAHEKD